MFPNEISGEVYSRSDAMGRKTDVSIFSEMSAFYVLSDFYLFHYSLVNLNGLALRIRSVGRCGELRRRVVPIRLQFKCRRQSDCLANGRDVSARLRRLRVGAEFGATDQDS